MCKVMEDMRNESLQEGLRIGKKEGRKEGEKEEKKMTALRMLELVKYALEEISNISGLPIDEVKKLRAGQDG